ncbi:SDR family NAD(P)-dependent oxidoreductase [uncultured Microbacterium sp.]|uniref:SDR family NAD(P)-dependent oxidoreductase n=1 Tax=uncultured Microbacterium sp. TaxID=191216 RepID=UPI0035CB7A13
MPDSASHTIVTGGASGIGAAVVADLLHRGHEVTVFDLTEIAADDHGSLVVDVLDEAAVSAAVDLAAAERGRVTGVVACHGIRGAYVPAVEIELASVRRLFDVHVVATLSVCREVVRRLDSRPGSIVLISSTTAYRGWANQADYGPAKSAVSQLMQNLAIEWATLGVRVNAVAPGHTRTPMVEDLVAAGYDLDQVRSRAPLGRLAEPDEVAGAITYLLCDATFVTGQCLAVDGGWTVVGK